VIGREKADEVVERLNELPRRVITVQEFISTHFDELHDSGQSLKELHQFLQSNGVAVGTFDSFRVTYGRVKRERAGNKDAKSPPKPPEISKTHESEEIHEPNSVPEVKQSAVAHSQKRGGGLRPLTSADGVELEIDPETGARTFKI